MCKLRNQKTKTYVSSLKSNPDLNGFVQRLRYWRKKNNFSQIDLSIECGFYQNKIPDIETLYTSCSVTDVYIIAKVLKIPPAILFLDDEIIINQILEEFKKTNGNTTSQN